MKKTRGTVDEVGLKDWKNPPEENFAHSLLLLLFQVVGVKLGVEGGKSGVDSVSETSQRTGVFFVNCRLNTIEKFQKMTITIQT